MRRDNAPADESDRPPQSRPARILFGGSFDPPTVGHRRMLEIARGAFPEAEIVVIPAGNPPHKQDRAMTEAATRLRMAAVAFGHLPGVRISDEEVRAARLSYTVETLEKHRAALGDGELYWLFGSDSLLDFPNWREPSRILELAHILTVIRPGFPTEQLDRLALPEADRAKLRAGVLPEPCLPTSSTEVRARLHAGRDASDLVDASVLTFIREHGLYPRDSSQR